MTAIQIQAGQATFGSGSPALWLEDFWTHLRNAGCYIEFCATHPAEVQRLTEMAAGHEVASEMETEFGKALRAVVMAQRWQ